MRTGPEADDTVALAQALLRIDTVNPPGNEAAAARLVTDRLRAAGLPAELHEFAPGRAGVVARLGRASNRPALCLCGHLDTVPVGTQPWAIPPFQAEIDGDRLHGRGATDMKAGVAAMVTAFERVARTHPEAPLTLALCASEETGCQGARAMADALGPVGALVVAEPTAGRVAVGHKGVLWLRLSAKGTAAHGSMPERGDNAIGKLMAALLRLGRETLPAAPHPLLGRPTLNVGTIAGGSATNIVPDLCEATLDIRLTPAFTADQALAIVRERFGPDIVVDTLLALDAVATDPATPWIQTVLEESGAMEGMLRDPISVSYFTDASVLGPALGDPPVAIVGPGDPALAHQVDEWCSIAATRRASILYERLARDWAGAPVY